MYTKFCHKVLSVVVVTTSAYLILLLTKLCVHVCPRTYYSATRFQKQKKRNTASASSILLKSKHICVRILLLTKVYIYRILLLTKVYTYRPHTHFPPRTARNMASGGQTPLSSHTSMQVTDPHSIHVSSYYSIHVSLYYCVYYLLKHTTGHIYVLLILLYTCVRMLLHMACGPTACVYGWWVWVCVCGGGVTEFLNMPLNIVEIMPQSNQLKQSNHFF